MRLFVLIAIFFFSITTRAQEIALTFDDAPLGAGPLFSGHERADKILAALKEHQVQQAAFFVVTSFIDSTGFDRLQKYTRAGHVLANHSHTHSHINRIGTENYIKDIQMADSIMKATLPYKRWYRYPFLDEGRTRGARDSIRAALDRLGLLSAYVTVDNYDWHLNGALRRALQKNAKVDYDRLRELYIEHIWNSIQFYDRIGRQVLNRSPKHVLLLHENDLSALFLSDLLKFLKSKGCKLISAEDAYTDPISSQIPDVLFNNQGRIGAIAFAKGMKPVELVQESEDEEYLDKLLESRKVFTF